MLGGSNISRCCHHVHLTTSTSTSSRTATTAWSVGRRVLSTTATSARILVSPSRPSTQFPSSSIPASSFTPWLASPRSRPKMTAMSVSTANKKPPVRPSPTQKASPSAAVTSTVAAGSTKVVDGKSPSSGPKLIYPERLIIYHAGTGKIIFLASLKLTTIFAFVFFDLWALPSFLGGAAEIYQSLGVALCGIIPATFVAYTTSPYVTTIHMTLPPFARVSAASLERFAKAVPPTTKLDMTTLSFIGKPRRSSLTVGDLRPVSLPLPGDKKKKQQNRRLGMVNYTRDVMADNAARKWWRFRAVGNFGIQVGNEANEKKLPKSGWVWRLVQEVIQRRAGLAAVGAEKGQGLKGKK